MTDEPLIRIRPMTLNDSELVHKWRTNIVVSQHLRANSGYTVEDQRQWFLHNNSDINRFWIIEEMIEHGSSVEICPVGVVGLTSIDTKNRTCEIHHYLGDRYINAISSYWRSVSIKSIQLAIRELKTDTSVTMVRIFIEYFTSDVEKYRLAHCADFQLPGYFKTHESLRECVIIKDNYPLSSYTTAFILEKFHGYA